ncbi:hypothetical protein H310_09792 [Aphanomyces invadans]|uniref:RGS domain-containing protein n=1 Tax=Aphanomyces invadans TaxID=157072 RepID=A0A024TS25_9STRA|nr:hypothetical protein H310_09792 [Aphanomyces invadans]ETV96930.1 hypothetical protein H310_09792 [Aphanomyces invadans]|eukprot:XP_008874176.1 hypothetical protein H310_09792 [Aphanomyces invadans]
MTVSWARSVPLGLCWCGYLYMPVVLYLYITHMHHSPIKYCQPHLVAITGFFCTLFCLTTPAIHVFGSTWPCGVHIVCNFIFPVYVCVSYLLSAAAVVIMFKITDLVANHIQFTPWQVQRLTLYRWLLYPNVQVATVAGVGSVLALPAVVVVVHSTSLSMDELHQAHKLNVILLASTSTSVLCGSVVGLWLSKLMPPYMDNLGLRRKYQRTNRATAIILCIGMVHSGLEVMWTNPIGEDYHVRNILFTLLMQYLFLFNIALPLRQVATKLPATTQSSQVSSFPSATNHLAKEMDQFLRSPHGAATILEFCQRDFRTEEIRAWQLVEQFKQRLVSAPMLFATCLAPGCPLACPIAIRWGPTYAARLESWSQRDMDIVGSELTDSFFNEFQMALLEALSENVWLRFKQQSVEWSTLQRRRRSLEGMDSVLRMVVKAPPVTSTLPRTVVSMSEENLSESMNDEPNLDRSEVVAQVKAGRSVATT